MRRRLTARSAMAMVSMAATLLLGVGSAWALGSLVSAEGSTISATRVLVVRSNDEVRIISQARYVGTPATAVWLLPLPQFGDPVDDGVIAQAFGQAGLDELDAATWPVLTGECDGMPTGAMQAITQADTWGPAPAMPLPVRFFPVQDLEEGRLTDYLTDLGLTADEATAAAIADVIDQNFMLAAVRIDTAMLGVNRVDPVVNIRYPLAAGDDLRLGLRMLEPSSGGEPADVVMWVLDQSRARANVTTEALDHGGVRFITPTETDYTAAFDMQVGVRQSQMFIWEYAGPVDGGTFGDPEIGGLITGSGATFLTRLRARIIPAALRNNLAFVTLREAGNTAVERTHPVEGFMCGGEMPPDDMGPAEADMAMGEPDVDPGADMGVAGDGGLVAGDMGDDDDDGGGGSSGCVAIPGLNRGLPAALLALICLLPLGLRRRRG